MSVKCCVLECTKLVYALEGKNCKFCDQPCCFDHLEFKKHKCPKTEPLQFLRKHWLRKKLQNVSSGRYLVVCDQCGYVSQGGVLIDVSGEERTQHIANTGCDQKKVFLEEVVTYEMAPTRSELESLVPFDRQFYVCSHCRPPSKFTNRADYIGHHFTSHV